LVGSVGEIKASQAIVTCRQADPCRRILRRLLDRVAEVLLGYAEIAAIEMLEA